jgi:hypothetical protein
VWSGFFSDCQWVNYFQPQVARSNTAQRRPVCVDGRLGSQAFFLVKIQASLVVQQHLNRRPRPVHEGR